MRTRPAFLVATAAAIAAVVLAVWGYHLDGTPGRATNHFYSALRLFVFELDADPASLNVQIEIARLLAPASLALGAFAAFLQLSRETLHALSLRFASGHTIVTGSGPVANAFLHDAAGRDHHLVHIAPRPGSDHPRIIHLHGDPADPDLLVRARVTHAARLVALDRDDTANVATTNAAAAILADAPRTAPRTPLACHPLIDRPALVTPLKRHDLFAGTPDAIDIAVLDLHAVAASETLTKYPLEVDAGKTLRDTPHLVLFDLCQGGESLLVHALRTGHFRTRTSLRVTLVTSPGSPAPAGLRHRYPQLHQVAELDHLTAGGNAPADLADAFFASLADRDPATFYTIALCLDDDTANFVLAQELRGRHVDGLDGRVLVHLSRPAGLADLLARGSSPLPMHPVPSNVELADWPTVIERQHDRYPRAIHTAYVEKQLAAGKTPDRNPSLVVWDRLPEHLRDQNRAQLAHLPVKLRAIGLSPTAPPPRPQLEATLRENLELLAEIEHRRWVAEQHLAGYVHAPGPKDPVAKTHPDLVPYADLPDAVKQYDRDAILEIPNLLA